MQIEYEATFININKDEMRKKLESVGAELVRSEFLQKRMTFDLPEGHEIKGGWLRLRDEVDKITMTLKVIDGDKMEDQKEILLTIDDMKKAEELLTAIGCRKKSFQESKREIWKLDNVEIMIDDWPHLYPYVEVEGDSEEEVRKVSEKIGFDYKDALFCPVCVLYGKKYNIPEDVFNNLSLITFSGENPFEKYAKGNRL